MSVIKNYINEKVVDPIVKVIKSGITVEQLSLSIACGICGGLFPVPAATTIICGILSYLFSLTLIVSILGLSQYFLRNISTVFYYSGELKKTKKFLLTNKNKIEIYPGFSFMLDKSLKFVSLGYNNKEKMDSNLKIYSINGHRNPCIENINYKNKSQEIKIFSKKIFNSNSGYGIWICD